MTISFRPLLIMLGVSLLSLFALILPVHADSMETRVLPVRHFGMPNYKAVNLIVEPLKPLVIGDHPTIVVHLNAELGQPIPNQPIYILVDGVRKAKVKTDSRGIAIATLNYDFPAGTYDVQVIYPGILKIGLPRTTAQMGMRIEPARVAIYTVPPVPYANFKLNNRIYIADENGVADIEVNTSGLHSLEVLPVSQEHMPSNIKVEFARWNDNVFTAHRQIYFPRTRRLEAGFLFNYQVNQEFYDSKGELVDPARVSSMTLRGVGTTYKFDKAGLLWLPANRLTRRIGEHLESEDILYYFRDITIDGANVVNKSEQRFHIRPNDIWPIQVLMYSAHFSAQDAVFHFPTGKGIELTYPDGHKEEIFFDSLKSEIMIPYLARGSYNAKVIGVDGSAPPTPIHLSRDQSIELLVFSYVDMGVFLGIGLFISLGLLLYGRPLLVSRATSFGKGMIFRRPQFAPAPQLLNEAIAFGAPVFSNGEIGTLEDSSPVRTFNYPVSTEAEPTNRSTPNHSHEDEKKSDGSPDHSMNEILSLTPQEEIPSFAERETSVPVLDQVQSAEEITQIETTEVVSVASIDETSNLAQVGSTSALLCQTCGSSQLIKKGKRHGHQRYQCKSCGAYNIFESKQARRSRQKGNAENLV